MCKESDLSKIAASHGLELRAMEETLHALHCFGWHCYAPGNPVIALVEAARFYASSDSEPRATRDLAAALLKDAARRVAEVAGNIRRELPSPDARVGDTESGTTGSKRTDRRHSLAK